MRQVNLKVNARHISQLGRELVTDFVTALVELVKNSYDADSPAVKIKFENVKTANGKIIIVDSGIGMTQQDVDEKWTVIGTNNKVRNSHSPKGRKHAGKKGIGRFSVERLAEKVVMYSFSNKEEPFKFTINWNKYEEINSLAMNQGLQRLLHNPNDIESAKFVHSHIDYFLNNDNISDEDKNHLISNALDGYSANYTYFNNNERLIKNLLSEFIPLLEKYQSEEIRIQDIFHELDYLNEEETKQYKNMIDDLRKQVGMDKQNETTGLVMVLEGLRDQWKQKELIKVQKELRLLVAPNFLQEDAFIPILDASEFHLEEEVVVNDILDLSYAKIKAGVVENGNVIQINYQDKKNRTSVLKRLVQKKPLVCGELDVELYYFVRDTEHLTSKDLNVRHARQILDQFCGIKIYRDGFHIKPYGDVGNDWLLLDQNKVKDTHSYLVGNNQVIGIVNISEESNPLLVDATNREAIIENDAFNDLKKFVGECTRYISEQRRLDYEKEKKQKSEFDKLIIKKREEEEKRRKEEELRERQKNKEFELQQKKLNSLLQRKTVTKKVLTQVSQLTKSLQDQKDEEITYYKDRLKEEKKQHEEITQKTENFYKGELFSKERELSLYKNLATLGMLTGAFGHETADIINRMGVDINYTKRWFPQEIFNQRPGVLKAYDKIFSDFKRIQGYSELISGFVKKNKREKLDFVNFKNSIENITTIYNDIIKTQNIDVKFELKDFNSSFKMYTIDLESIVINLLTNAFEALKQTSKKQIIINTNENEAYQEIIFIDNGPGIGEGYEKLIFSPFMTTKSDGIGLGLSIVRDIVEKYNGKIFVENSSEYGGAEFHIQFPKEE